MSRLLRLMKFGSLTPLQQLGVAPTFSMQSFKLESFFFANGNEAEASTFYHDERLPSLPLPKLNDTLKKYLDSCEAVLMPEELSKTKKIVEQFSTSEGPKLHTRLTERARSKRNWLEEWWLNGYLDYRGPLGYLNFFGGCEMPHWPPKENSQLERSSVLLHVIMKFWKLLRDEKLSQHKESKGNSFSMNQFRNLFNTSRIPQHGRDRLEMGFRTASEGSSPTHIIIFYRHRIYKAQCVDPKTGEIYTPPQFFQMLSSISQNNEFGIGVAAMTELDRETWCDARSYLMNLTEKNRKYVEDIETALMCIAINDLDIKDFSELLHLGATKSLGNRWADKSFNYQSSKNGLFVCYNDHTPFDGMVFVTLMNYISAYLHDVEGEWNGSWIVERPTEPVLELKFTVNEKINGWVEKGKEVITKLRQESDLRVMHFNKFGKRKLRALKMHPVAFVQICIQLAYMRKHGKPAPTYETATTRAFYNGRTETLRSCTPEMVAFCNAMIHGLENKKVLFKKAYDKYIWQMGESKAGMGCDRHLLGLATIAKESGEALPELFTDPGFEKSGGNGNFVLSTSFTGYGSPIGAVVPMRYDGYGTFFRIMDEGMSFALTAWYPCKETDTCSMGRYIEDALNDVYMLTMDNMSRL